MLIRDSFNRQNEYSSHIGICHVVYVIVPGLIAEAFESFP
jgi:hypothetical protein